MTEGRTRELQRPRLRVLGVADPLPFEHVLAEPRIPVAGGGTQVGLAEPVGRRIGEGEERGGAVVRVARPPPDPDLLGIAAVAHDEVVRRRVGRPPGEEADRQVERPPPCVDRRRAAAKRGAELRQDQRRLGYGIEVGRDLVGLIGRVFVVLVERDVPGNLLRLGIDLDRATEASHRIEHLPRHLTDGPVRSQGDPHLVAVAVLDHGLMSAQVEGRDERARPVRGGERKRLPAPCGQPQRGVLELWLGRGELDRELPEHLRVGVERVACLAPPAV